MTETQEITDLYPGRVIRLTAANTGIVVTVKLDDGSTFSATLHPGSEVTYTVGTKSGEIILDPLPVPLGVQKPD